MQEWPSFEMRAYNVCDKHMPCSSVSTAGLENTEAQKLFAWDPKGEW